MALGCHLHNVDFTRNVGDFLSSPDLIGADPTECVQLFHDVSSSFVETTDLKKKHKKRSAICEGMSHAHGSPGSIRAIILDKFTTLKPVVLNDLESMLQSICLTIARIICI